MKFTARQAVLATAACCTLVAAGSSTPSTPVRELALAAEPMPVSTDDAGERWIRGTRAALDNPTAIEMPYTALAELAGPDGGAAVFAFDGVAGQTLELTLARDAAEPGERVYVEVFRVVDVLGEALHQRLTTLRPGASSSKTRLPSDGPYHVLVQTGASGDGRYRLTLELAPALPFPVVGAKRESIRGLFGASRDSGKRHHEGVDIFVQRLTPVLAVAAGRAMPRKDALGGNTVWLNTPGTSYYYAHLDRVAVREDKNVKAGDVLGYVGNTGNAGGTPSHLHFGVYRWGKEPIDPLPLLVGRRFEERPASTVDAGG
jgi:murein DD-endopeptidase MepM/ murein hydrolase activator NlpD